MLLNSFYIIVCLYRQTFERFAWIWKLDTETDAAASAVNCFGDTIQTTQIAWPIIIINNAAQLPNIQTTF